MIKNIYIHLPFCIKKCKYCDFAVHAVGNQGSDLMTTYIEKLKAEIRYW